jgi:hypothetical protein
MISLTPTALVIPPAHTHPAPFGLGPPSGAAISSDSPAVIAQNWNPTEDLNELLEIIWKLIFCISSEATVMEWQTFLVTLGLCPKYFNE